MPFIVCLCTTMSYAIVLPHLTSHPQKPFFVANDCYAMYYAASFLPMVNKKSERNVLPNHLPKRLWKDRVKISPFGYGKNKTQQISCQSVFVAFGVYTTWLVRKSQKCLERSMDEGLGFYPRWGKTSVFDYNKQKRYVKKGGNALRMRVEKERRVVFEGVG